MQLWRRYAYVFTLHHQKFRTDARFIFYRDMLDLIIQQYYMPHDPFVQRLPSKSYLSAGIKSAK